MKRSALALGASLILSAGAAPAQPSDWSQFDYDSRHSGVNLEETTIHAGNVATLHFVYSITLPSIADGAPAFLQAVTTPAGVKDLLFLTTKSGTLLARDAATGATVWSKQAATGPNYTTSSPAIDPSRQFVYSYGLDGKVHKYAVGDGTEVVTGGWPELATLKPSVEKGSSALSLATALSGATYLYVANGGYPGDAGDYQGHVTAIDLATGAQKVFNAACSDQTVHFTTTSPDCAHVQTAVWARPGAIYDTDNDRLFFATGNGDYDGNAGGHEWGDSVLAIHPDGSGLGGLPVDSYTPTEFQQLQNTDADLGSAAPVLLPTPPGSSVTHLGVQSGKDGKLRLLNLDNLSGLSGPGHLAGELQKIDVPQGGEVLPAQAAWVDPLDGSVWVFVTDGSGISGLQVTVSGGVPSLTPRWNTTPGGSSPIVVNGILFYASSSRLRGLDPASGTELWSDTNIGGVHWESPIVVNGRLYVTDEGSKLWAYAPDAEPLSYFTVTPCRAVDTRSSAGTFGGPALAGNGAKRLFPLAGRCGVPAAARSVAVNLTVVTPTSDGDLRAGPTGIANPTSTINFRTGQVRANNAVLSLTGNPLGSVTMQADLAGTSHLVIDVVGYFQ